MSAAVRLLLAALCALAVPLASAQEPDDGTGDRVFYQDTFSAPSEETPADPPFYEPEPQAEPFPAEPTPEEQSPEPTPEDTTPITPDFLTVGASSAAANSSMAAMPIAPRPFPVGGFLIAMGATILVGIGWYAFRYYIEGGLPGSRY